MTAKRIEIAALFRAVPTKSDIAKTTRMNELEARENYPAT